MRDFAEQLIRSDASVIDALKQLHRISTTSENLTLFVVDGSGRMIGTVTDGDVRRGFIGGLGLSAPVRQFMRTGFRYVNGHKIDVRLIRAIRREGVRLLPILDNDRHVVGVHDLRRQRSILPVECMLMAGGRGERLRPLTDNVPKPLLPVGNKPIIGHMIDHLICYGIEKIHVSLRHLGQQIVDYYGDGSSRGIVVSYVWEKEPLGTAGALSLVDDFQAEYVLLANGDLFTDADLEDLYLRVVEEGAAMGVASTPYTVSIPYAIFDEEGGAIKAFQEKPVHTSYASAGIYLFRRDCIEGIPKNRFFNITDLLQKLIDAREKVIHNPIVGYWIDIGKHEDYRNANEIAKHLNNGNH